MKLRLVSSGIAAAFLSQLAPTALADGPADNIAESVRPIPPIGIEVSDADRKSLEDGLATFGKQIDGLKQSKEHADIIAVYLPDVEICHKAVRYALENQEFHKAPEIKFALDLLKIGEERAAQLLKGEIPWTRQTGFVFRGYRSEIDGSPQPYGLEIPDNYRFDGKDPWRLDFWFHGRGETLSELSFIQQRIGGRGGKITPKDTIILHPYARYSNANKFAGEVDMFEALAHARRDYRIDEDRILVRGFSMGGAACWQFAVHYPGKWAAAQPGAGFSETPDFLKTFQGEELHPTWWEEKLWRWYDATNWALNLSNYPVIAYSGENDRQKQAADMMVAATKKEGLDLVHLIGPGMEHKFHPDTLAEIEERLASIAKQGRTELPQLVRFITYTLRYNRMRWLQVDRLTQHWEPARVEASWSLPSSAEVTTSGVDAFSFQFAPGECPLDPLTTPVVTINGDKLSAPKPLSDQSWSVYFTKDEFNNWAVSSEPAPAKGLQKRHNLQGPIDDAFTSSFLFVMPGGKPQYDLVGEWFHAERRRAVEHWRKQFRGDARIKKDSEVSDDDIANHNLVLWGDPSSNSLIARIMDQLPIQWNAESIQIGDKTYDSKQHALSMIFPNPLNPDCYVVLNSGFTYREYDYLNNARQTPKLPDWAVFDLRTPPGTRFAGKVVDAGFFDENWRLTSKTQ